MDERSTDSRLAILETRIGAHDAAIRESLAHLQAEVVKIHELLSGNGKPETGLVVRVDRLEQNDQRRAWQVHATIVAMLAMLGDWVAKWLPHR